MSFGSKKSSPPPPAAPQPTFTPGPINNNSGPIERKATSYEARDRAQNAQHPSANLLSSGEKKKPQGATMLA